MWRKTPNAKVMEMTQEHIKISVQCSAISSGHPKHWCKDNVTKTLQTVDILDRENDEMRKTANSQI